MCAMTRSYDIRRICVWYATWQNSFMSHEWVMSHMNEFCHMTYDESVCDMWYATWQNSFMWDMNHSCGTSLIRVTYDSFMWRGVATCDTQCNTTHSFWHTAHSCETRLIQVPATRAMWWLQFVGSLKLYVAFAKEPCKRDYILQKRPIILSAYYNRTP